MDHDDHTDDESSTASPSASSARGMLARDDLPFLPKVRWVFWAPLIAVLAIMVSAYFVAEARRGRRLRAQLIQEHGVLTQSLAPPYRELRGKIERLTHAVAGPWQGTYTAAGFTMVQLTAEPVLYGRVRLGEIHTLPDVAASIRHRYADQVASCMGVEVQWVHQFYTRGDFLMPSYVQSVASVSDGDRLAALRQDLQFRLRRDTPDLVQWTRARYLVVAMDEAALSIDGPTRVYVWDLRDERILLRARGDSGDTVLIPVRIAGMPGGGRPIPQPSGNLTLTQHDCAVANIAREQLGVDVLTMHNAPSVAADPPTPAAGVAPPVQTAVAPSASDAR